MPPTRPTPQASVGRMRWRFATGWGKKRAASATFRLTVEAAPTPGYRPSQPLLALVFCFDQQAIAIFHRVDFRALATSVFDFPTDSRHDFDRSVEFYPRLSRHPISSYLSRICVIHINKIDMTPFLPPYIAIRLVIKKRKKQSSNQALEAMS